jgi:MFS family permease
MKLSQFRPLLFLTLGWFGIEMAMALDATQFQILLDQRFEHANLPTFTWSLLGLFTFPIGKASLIAMVMSLGPLAGITVQPFMGWLGDKLHTHGVTRRSIMKQALFYSWICTVLFALKLSLWALIAAIGLFFVSFNALNVNYRALVTETSNRPSLMPHKGTVSGLVALFSGLGGFCMFMLFKIFGDSQWPPIFAAAVLLVTALLVFRYAPGPKEKPRLNHQERQDIAEKRETQIRSLNSVWHWLFYIFPLINLIPPIEKKLVRLENQKPIFRLFLVIFFAWMGIQALRAFFVLLATKDLHVSYQNASLAMAVLTLVMVASALPLGKLADKLDNRLMLIYCLLGFSLVCLIAFFAVHSYISILLMCVLLGASFAGMVVMPLSLLFKLCPRQSEGVYSGLYNLFMSVPQLYSLFMTGWLVDIFHSYRVILMVGAVSVACALLLAFRLPKTLQINKQDSAHPALMH